jgi:hypothetical protein
MNTGTASQDEAPDSRGGPTMNTGPKRTDAQKEST